MNTDKPKQGGVRPNSGRPAPDGAKNVKNVSIALTPAQIEWLDQGGSKSAKVRALIDKEIAAEAKKAAKRAA
jgi:ribosomal protein S16